MVRVQGKSFDLVITENTHLTAYRYYRSCLCLIDIAQAPSLYNIIIGERTRVGKNGQVLGMFMHSSFGELNK